MKLIILLLLSFPCLSQQVFKPGYYTKGTVVIDSLGQKWEAKANFTAKAYPKVSTYWQRFTGPSLTLDSLQREIDRLKAFTLNPIFKLNNMEISFFSMSDSMAAHVREPEKGLMFYIKDGKIIINTRP